MGSKKSNISDSYPEFCRRGFTSDKVSVQTNIFASLLSPTVQQQLQYQSYRQTWTTCCWFQVWEGILASCSCWKVQQLGMVWGLVDHLSLEPRKLGHSYPQPLVPGVRQKVFSFSLI